MGRIDRYKAGFQETSEEPIAKEQTLNKTKNKLAYFFKSDILLAFFSRLYLDLRKLLSRVKVAQKCI